MGNVNNTVFIATGEYGDLYELREECYKYLIGEKVWAEFFNLITIIDSHTNDQATFIIASCGSKLGWDRSNAHAELVGFAKDYCKEQINCSIFHDNDYGCRSEDYEMGEYICNND